MNLLDRNLFHFFFWFISLLFFSFSLYADNDFPEAEGWSKKTKQFYDKNGLFNYINGAATTYHKYGFKRLHVQEYEKNEAYIIAEKYIFTSDAHAFGMYKAERPEQAKEGNFAAGSYIDGSSLNFWKDSVYTKIYSNIDHDTIMESIKKIGQQISAGIHYPYEYPPAFQAFPTNGLLKQSYAFIPTHFLGYDFLKNVYTAGYTIKKDTFTLFLILNSECPEGLKVFEPTSTNALNQEDEELYSIDDKYNGTLFFICRKKQTWGLLDANGIETAKMIQVQIERSSSEIAQF